MPAEEQVRAPLPVVTERLVGNILPSVSRPRSVREIGEGGGCIWKSGRHRQRSPHVYFIKNTFHPLRASGPWVNPHSPKPLRALTSALGVAPNGSLHFRPPLLTGCSRQINT